MFIWHLIPFWPRGSVPPSNVMSAFSRYHTMKKILMLLCAGLLVNGTRAEDKPAATHKPDDVVARVGGTAIKWQEVDTAVHAFARQFTAYGRSFPEEQLPQLQYNIVNDMVS